MYRLHRRWTWLDVTLRERGVARARLRFQIVRGEFHQGRCAYPVLSRPEFSHLRVIVCALLDPAFIYGVMIVYVESLAATRQPIHQIVYRNKKMNDRYLQ